MANNRMFLCCPCGEREIIAKHFGDVWIAKVSVEIRLDDFFHKHAECGLVGYTLVHEHE